MKRLILVNVPIKDMVDGETYVLACIPRPGKEVEVGGIMVRADFLPAQLQFFDDDTGERFTVEMEPTA